MSITTDLSVPAQLSDVIINDAFWAPRQRLNREVTIPFQYEQLKKAGHIDAFDLKWIPGAGQRRHFYYDSDVAKWVEAVSYSFATHPDAESAKLLDDVVNLIVNAQLPDGYLNTYFSAVKPEDRWTDLYDAHELYQAGHLMEAAVAHSEATGNPILLDAMRRYADYIDSVFGMEPGKKRGYCGHPEIELALVRLYHATGEERYLKLSKYFVDERGQEPNYYDAELRARGKDPHDVRASADNYIDRQAHKPLREQTEVVGHAVRAMYIYCGMADLAAEYGDDELHTVCRRLWDNLTLKRLYVHGGIGSTGRNEGFTSDYDLPNDTAYAETCAAIALVFWAHRMLRLDCDSRYSDVMEQALYNGFLSSYSMDGKRFFYENRLASLGNHHRQDWFWCACCPPNFARLMASLGRYIYSQTATDTIVNLYVGSSGKLRIDGHEVMLRQETNYPWDGKVTLHLEMMEPFTFGLRLRIPDWSRGARVWVNGSELKIDEIIHKGYARIERMWANGDKVEIDLPMPVERVYAHPDVRADFGRVALQRGPIVYCIEEADNPAPHRVILPDDSELNANFDSGLLGGAMTISGQALIADDAYWRDRLYRTDTAPLKQFNMKAIPYYAWDNRTAGEMAVWIAST